MKVVRTCDEVEPNKVVKKGPHPNTLKPGTIFRTKSRPIDPTYMRTNEGFVSLEYGLTFSHFTAGDTEEGLKIYPNATVVLGE